VEATRLSQYFHPVARSSEVGERLSTFRLMDEEVVLYRGSDGRAVAFKDLCIHRGSRLSLGEVTPDGNLRCAYHGWEYAPDGACVRIPSLPLDAPIPAKARAITYPTEERYDTVWVALEDPVAGVPPFPNDEWGDPAWRGFLMEAQEWNAAAGRILENFCDRSHVPWVHPAMASRDRPEIEPYDVWHRNGQLGYTIGRSDNPRARDLGTLPFTAPSGREKNEFVVTLPFTAHLRQVLGAIGETTIVTMTAAPLGPKLSRVYMWNTRNHNLGPEHDETMQRFARQVMEEDRAIVERQRPELIPLDLRDEMHLKVPDAFSIVYRRLLDEFGPDESFLHA
jgi:phenylpropionate dioxygenase-like ring-hydroxylating dioxygenase large terminal subunit